MGGDINAHRCARAHQVLTFYGTLAGVDWEDSVTDLLTDIRHLCDDDPELDFERALRLSAMHHGVEAAEANFFHCGQCSTREGCAESVCCTWQSGLASAEDTARIERAIGGPAAPPLAGKKFIYQYSDTAMHVDGRPPEGGELGFDVDARWVAADCELDADRAAEERGWAPCGGLIFEGEAFPEADLTGMGVDYVVPAGYVA
jgi:hypothetical protein